MVPQTIISFIKDQFEIGGGGLSFFSKEVEENSTSNRSSIHSIRCQLELVHLSYVAKCLASIKYALHINQVSATWVFE